MQTSVFPVEDMLGVGGWFLYVFVAALFLFAIIWASSKTIGYWRTVVRLFISSRRNGSTFLPTVSQMVLGSTMFPVLALLIWFYVSMVILQVVQIVRFDNQQIELVYRWPWLNQKIPYRSITSVRLKDAPSRFAIRGLRPREGFPIEVLITTQNGTYEIGPQPPRFRGRIVAVYDELKRHSHEFARN